MLFQITIPIASNIGSDAPLSLGPYFSNIVGVALTVAALATLIYLVWGGISWITAGGEEKKIEDARNRITGALIGLAIVAVSWAIFLIIDNFLGIGITGGNGGGGGGGGVNGLCGCSQQLNGPGKCAKTGDISPLTANQNYVCDANQGWIKTNASWSGNPITCYPCP